MAAIYDLYITKGDTFTQTLSLGSDKTGSTMSCEIYDESNTLVTATIAWVTIGTGEFKIDITALNTSALLDGVGIHRVRETDSGGVVTTILEGNVYINGGVK